MIIGLPLLLASWVLLWTRGGFWNPLIFAGLWTGAILLMYAAGDGYPGLRRHATLAALSIPLWWWFELVNMRVGNWEYLSPLSYDMWQYVLFASLTFSTVVPALDAARGLASRLVPGGGSSSKSRTRGEYAAQIAAGLVLQAGAFALPDLLFPLVWMAPFVALDGLVGLLGGRCLVDDLAQRKWWLAAQIALGGLLCGFLWELWNFGATPKWVYHIPYVGFAKVFEMPLLGYGGYIPFAWSIYQLVALSSARIPRGASRVRRVQEAGVSG